MRAAYRLIGRDSGSVSVQEILDAAGLSTRAFYRHFASKDDLILAMYRTDNERVSDALWAATEAEPDAWKALRAWVDISLSVAFDHAPERHSKVLGSAEAKSAAGWSTEHLEGIERQIASLEAVLARGGHDGTFPITQVRPDADVIFAATEHFNSIRMASGPDALTRQAALDAVMEAASRMLGIASEKYTTRRASKRPARPVSVAD
jgi:AcrR family transcriptional regulator